MHRELTITADGSSTVSIPELQVTYHSKHGAVQESMHVFIEAGLQPLLSIQPALHIFEMGLGTGLNALLTLIEAEKNKQPIYYEAVEPFPLEEDLITSLNYCQVLQRPDLEAVFKKIHTSNWNESIALTPFFTLVKRKTSLLNLPVTHPVHLIYFDAFSPVAQPELWTTAVFAQLSGLLAPGGLLVTYCSKSEVRRNMQAAGFTVEKIPGPHGKREMVRAKRSL